MYHPTKLYRVSNYTCAENRSLYAFLIKQGSAVIFFQLKACSAHNKWIIIILAEPRIHKICQQLQGQTNLCRLTTWLWLSAACNLLIFNIWRVKKKPCPTIHAANLCTTYPKMLSTNIIIQRWKLWRIIDSSNSKETA